MNIALISREYPPFFGGGIGSYTQRFARALADGGHRPVVVTVSGDGEERCEEDRGILIVRIPFIAGHDWSGPHPRIAGPEAIAAFHTFNAVSVMAMQVAAAMPRLARELGLEVIEAPDTGALAWFLLNARRTGAPEARDLPPVVTTIHSPTEWIAEWNGAPLRGRAEHELAFMERDQARWSDGLVCPSGAMADWAAARWEVPRERIAVVPYALGELEAVARRHAEGARGGGRGGRGGRGDPPTARRRILFVGRLEPRKGVDTLIEAFAAAPGSLELHLLGQDMPDPRRPGLFGENAIADFLKEGDRARVQARGKTDPAEVERLLGSAGVAVVPAPMDNFPFTCIEAMAHGRPVVAADAGGMAEMVRDGKDGLLFSPGDAASCAGALGRIAAMGEEDLRTLGASAAGRIADLCGNGRVVAMRVEHYAGVIRPALPRAARGGARGADEVIVVNGASAPGAARLAGAVREGAGIDFAHGWTSHAGEVRAFSTPGIRSLAGAPRQIGPVALTRRAAADPRVRPLLRACPRSGEQTTESAWALAVALCAAGYAGAVVPEAITDSPPVPGDAPELAPLRSRIAELERRLAAEIEATGAAREHLARIRESRGFRLLERFYDLLHVLRGRGLSRPRDYHDLRREQGSHAESMRPAESPRGRNQMA